MKSSTPLVTVLILLTGFSVARAQSLEAFEQDLIRVARKARPSVVAISAIEGQGAEAQVASRFSGIILDKQGHVATVADAVASSRSIIVRLIDGRVLPAKVVGSDAMSNIAVLKLDYDDIRPVEPAPESPARVGAFVLAVGNPFGLNHSVVTGIVSGTDRTLGWPGKGVVSGMIQTTAPINPGDAGGLLADSRGRFLGMITSTFGRSPSLQSVKSMMRELVQRLNRDPEFKALVREFFQLIMGIFGAKDQAAFAAKFAELQNRMERAFPEVQSGPPEEEGLGRVGSSGINFAIPGARVRQIASQIIAHGRVIRGRIGIRGLSVAGTGYHQAKYDIPKGVTGVLVLDVQEGGPAAKAGILRFDVVLRYHDEPVRSPFELMGRVFATQPGTAVTLRVWRRGKGEMDVDVTIEELAGK